MFHFCNKRLPPLWFLIHHWNNCIALMDSMTVRVLHIFREGNGVANRLANLGAAVDSFTRWDTAPSEVASLLQKDVFKLPSYRFSYLLFF